MMSRICLPYDASCLLGRGRNMFPNSISAQENGTMPEMGGLIESIIPALRRYARTFVRDTCAADDLVQDALEQAISQWHQRPSDGNPRAWLFTILHNLAIDHLCRSARRGWELSLDDA